MPRPRTTCWMRPRTCLTDAVACAATCTGIPRIGNDLPRTRERMLEAIDDLGLDVTLHESTSGVAAVLDGGRPGPTILLAATWTHCQCTRTRAPSSPAPPTT